MWSLTVKRNSHFRTDIWIHQPLKTLPGSWASSFWYMAGSLET